MKAVYVDAKRLGGIPIPFKYGEIHIVSRVGSTPCCGKLVLDFGMISHPRSSLCLCGKEYKNGGIWWMSAARFRPLLGDEQEALDAIEQEVKETELIPEPA